MLVHCLMGHSRSVTLTVIYLSLIRNMNIDNAIEFIKKKDHQLILTKHFMNKLRNT